MKLKNKKGFTLIELLAVIVVLAIIALIATPIVMNTIKNAKKGSAERGADNYIKQVETAIATSKLDGKDVADGTYAIDENGNLTGNGLTEPITIEMNGEKPKSGSIVIKNGQVTTDSIMTIGDYTVSYNPTTKKYEATEKSNTTTVYRNSTDTIKIGDVIDPNDTSKFTKDTSTLGKSHYLKHVLDKDNKVIESYACAILKGKEYCLTNGEYGYAENPSDYTGNVLLLKKIKDAKIEGISCSFNPFDEGCCRVDNGHLCAHPAGDVDAHVDIGGCAVKADGSSYCA